MQIYYNNEKPQVENAYVLVWDFVDLITPVMKLESPQEVFCFRLNPTQPDIAVGGTLSGQVSYACTHTLSYTYNIYTYNIHISIQVQQCAHITTRVNSICSVA
jgi:hypothetical protein